MARPLRIEFAGAYYHVTARGDEQKDIFKSARDRERFFEYLLSVTERYGVVIHCYCLMGNHYHLFLETPRANLSQVMHHLNGSYTTYYNVKKKHVGHLFQGRYHGIVVEADAYALQLSRYMHLNPVRAGMVKSPEDYRWSSYRAYIGLDSPPAWLTQNLILASFGSNFSQCRLLYREFTEQLNGKEYSSPLDNVVASTVLGSEDFVESIIEEHLGGEKERTDVPAVRGLNHRFDIEKILQKTEAMVKDQALARDIALYLCQNYSGEKLKDIGRHFGLSDSGVTKASFRLRKKMEPDQALRETVARIAQSLGFVQT